MKNSSALISELIKTVTFHDEFLCFAIHFRAHGRMGAQTLIKSASVSVLRLSEIGNANDENKTERANLFKQFRVCSITYRKFLIVCRVFFSLFLAYFASFTLTICQFCLLQINNCVYTYCARCSFVTLFIIILAPIGLTMNENTYFGLRSPLFCIRTRADRRWNWNGIQCSLLPYRI